MKSSVQTELQNGRNANFTKNISENRVHPKRTSKKGGWLDSVQTVHKSTSHNKHCCLSLHCAVLLYRRHCRLYVRIYLRSDLRNDQNLRVVWWICGVIDVRNVVLYKRFVSEFKITFKLIGKYNYFSEKIYITMFLIKTNLFNNL